MARAGTPILLTVAGVVLGGALIWSYTGTIHKNKALRGELEELKTSQTQAQNSLNAFIEREESRKRAREVAEKNLRNLRKNFLEASEESRTWQGETNEIVQNAGQIEEERQRAEVSAADAKREANAHFQRAEKLSTDLEKAQRDKEAAEERERRRLADIKKSQSQIRQLAEKVKRAEAKESDYEKAIREYDQVQEDAEQAINALRASNRRVEALVRESSVAHYNLGVVYARTEQYVAAAREFELSIALDPNDPLSHYNLGLLYDTYLENPTGAMREYQAYLRLLPKAADAQVVEHRLHQVRLQHEVGVGRDLGKNQPQN